MKLPEGVTIKLDWTGDDSAPLITVGELRELLHGLDPSTPIYARLMDDGFFDYIEIGGEARG